MIRIVKLNELPDGSGNLSNDDIFLFMDNPSGSGTTKKISFSDISSNIAATIVDSAPVKNIVAGSNITVSSVSGTYTVASTGGSSITVANSGDNRILTSTGSSTGINAESNLTFDGSGLSVNGTAQFYQIFPTVSGVGNVSGIVNTNVSLAQVFDMTLTGNTTLANPINAVDGVTIRWRIRQDATGGRTVTLGNKFVIPSSATSPLPFSTAANKMDILAATYHAGRDKWDVVAFVMGY